MNLTLSLGIDGGATAKKRKVQDGVVDGGGFMALHAGDDGDHGRVMRLLQARERMARLDFDDDSSSGEATDGGMRLMHLLLSSVAAREAGDVRAAAAALQEVYRRASFRGGDPSQRVAAYFADALASRMVLRSPPPAARAERFLAFTMFYQASPLYQFAHFTANQAIVEAFDAAAAATGGGRRSLHVVDFDVSYGFQWPSLMQSLSDAAASSFYSQDGDEAAVSLRITGFSTDAGELRETEARLTRFASGCPNLRFEFDGVLNEPSIRHGRIKIDPAATVVVNLVFPATSSREASRTLTCIRSMNPSLVFLTDKEEGCDGDGGDVASGKYATRRRVSFLPRFATSLRYYAAVFNSLHECLPVDSAGRLAIERDHFGGEISDALASLDDHQRGGAGDHAALEATWKEAMERTGFEGVRLSSRTVSQAKLLLKMKSGGGGGFRIVEGDDGKAMSLGWRDMALITASGWRPRRRGDRSTSATSESDTRAL